MRADVRFVQKRHHIPRLFVKKLQPNREIRIRLADRLFSFFTILLSLCYLRRWYGSQRGDDWPPIASIFATQGAEWGGAQFKAPSPSLNSAFRRSQAWT